MKKIILLLGICIFLTGCTVDYSLDFSGENINEEIIVKVDGDVYEIEKNISDESDGFYIEKELVDSNIPGVIGNEDYHEKTIDVKDGKSTATFKYTYNYDNFNDSYIINRCFENVVMFEEEDYYYISLSGAFTCSEENDVNIKVTTDRVVMKHNADKEEDGTYYWTISASDEENDITFQMSNELKENVKSGFKLNKLQIFVLIILVLAVGAFFLLKKKFMNDQI